MHLGHPCFSLFEFPSLGRVIWPVLGSQSLNRTMGDKYAVSKSTIFDIKKSSLGLALDFHWLSDFLPLYLVFSSRKWTQNARVSMLS